MRSLARLQSIRARLILIPMLILPAMLAVAVTVLLAGSGERIAEETRSGMQTGRVLIGYAVRSLGETPNPDAEIRHLVGNLASVRHVQFFYLATETLGGTPPLWHAETPRLDAPQWFIDLFPAERPVETYPVMIHGAERGEIILVGNPLDEIGEVWAELVFLVGLLAGASVLILAALLWTARLVARPMQALSGGLDRLGRGEFAPIGRSRVSELQSIGERFNALAQSLDQARSDNRLLIDKLIMVQESERREIARELHDDFGATLFGIRTELALIRETQDPAAIGQHAAAMSGMIDDIQKQNYRMLDRLRPGSLAHARLSESIGDLVDAWAERHRGITWLLTIEDEIDGATEESALTIYRMVQEGLVNASRHAQAETVEVALAVRNGALVVAIRDDGRGLPAGFHMGFGLLGMSERVRRLGGKLSVANGAESGTVIEATIPWPRAETAQATTVAHEADMPIFGTVVHA
ncbi:histidine kinase [Dongia sedimenti]|uniref:Histidine kinase n=1 Tax=Dongia sedimenti TaxID=3064282 RepID=A0ABU0YMS8_9PROT|nr:histidine kinase [Rhodospirillaceae bacterium R-7]